MILVLDNYDSFTYNLVHLLYSLHADAAVFRNRETTAEEILSLHPDGILLSPGPSRPEKAGCQVQLIPLAAQAGIPMFGVCLGHQGLAQAFGGDIVLAKKIMHGKISLIEHTGKDMFAGIPSPMPVARYHSLAATYVPDNLEEIASFHGICMAVLNRRDRVLGFQFHPESVMTTRGAELLINSIRFLTE